MCVGLQDASASCLPCSGHYTCSTLFLLLSFGHSRPDSDITTSRKPSLGQVELAAPSLCWYFPCLSGGLDMDMGVEEAPCHPPLLWVGILGHHLSVYVPGLFLNLTPYL